MEKQGKVELTTKFKDIFPQLKDNPIVKEMYHQHGSNVVDLFKIFIYRMVLIHNADKKKEILAIPENIDFYEYLKGIKSEINSKTRYEDVSSSKFKITREHGEYILKYLKNKIKRRMEKNDDANKKSIKRQRSDHHSRSQSVDASADDRYHSSKRRKVRD